VGFWRPLQTLLRPPVLTRARLQHRLLNAAMRLPGNLSDSEREKVRPKARPCILREPPRRAPIRALTRARCGSRRSESCGVVGRAQHEARAARWQVDAVNTLLVRRDKAPEPE